MTDSPTAPGRDRDDFFPQPGAPTSLVETEDMDQTTPVGGPRAPEEGRRASLWADAWRELRSNPIFILATLWIVLVVVIALFPGLFTNKDPYACDLALSKATPSSAHWFGVDQLGCDYYAQTIYGARASIAVGVLFTIGTVTLGVVLGSLAGFYGGISDTLLSRFSDIIFGIPLLLGAIVILTVLSTRSILTVALVLTAIYWPTLVRIMRSSVIGTKQQDYVQAARALGASNGRLIRQHVLPNAIAPLIVVATINVGVAISAEATLSYLGVGLSRPAISWGLMISDAQALFRSFPHLLLFPGLFLSLTVLSFILLGDAVRDAIDPKLR